MTLGSDAMYSTTFIWSFQQLDEQSYVGAACFKCLFTMGRKSAVFQTSKGQMYFEHQEIII